MNNKKINDMKEQNEKNGFTPDDEINSQEENQEQGVNETMTGNDNLSDSAETENLQEKYNDLNDTYLRLQAEFDNYRKRTLKEKADLIKSGGERIILDLLPVVDDFERALENISASSDVDSVKQGVELIYNKFIDFLLKNGVKKMDVIGQPFDVDKHEALTTIPSENEETKGKVVDCVQPGYEMNDKVIRFPKVIVAK